MTSARYALILTLISALSGCGLLLTQGPPADYETKEWFDCSEDKTAPSLDVAFAALVIAAGLTVAADTTITNGDEDATVPLAFAAVWAGLFTTSAAVGFDRVKRCRAAKEKLAKREARASEAAPAGELSDSVAIAPTEISIDVGQVVQLTAKGFKAGRLVRADPFRWTSSNESVAWVVVRSGLVTALSPGTTVIAANANGAAGRVTVVVRNPK